MKVKAVHASQSAANPVRWYIELECGHVVKDSGSAKPNRRKRHCWECATTKQLK